MPTASIQRDSRCVCNGCPCNCQDLVMNQRPINQAPMPLTIAFGFIVDDHGVDLADKPQVEFGTFLSTHICSRA